VDESVLKDRLDQLFDNELMFHGFTKYMRDYELIVYQSVAPSSALVARHFRFLFRFCTEAVVRSSVRPDVWTRSTDDQLLVNHHVARDTPGVAWGVQCQILYPGATIIEDSAKAQEWTEQSGIPFHAVRIEETLT
jgi:hypothetical protein